MVPSVTPTHMTHIISSTAPTYAPHCHPLYLWTDHAGVTEKLAGAPQTRISDYPPSPHWQGLREWVDNTNTICRNILKYGSYYGFVCCDYCFPHVDVSGLSICIVCVLLLLCCLCEFGSRVIPSILWSIFMESVFICCASCVLYSGGSGVNSVHAVLYGLSMRLFVCFHAYISCWYD